MNMLSVFAALINTAPAIRHDSGDNIIIPLDYDVADEPTFGAGDKVCFVVPSGNLYFGVCDYVRRYTGDDRLWAGVSFTYRDGTPGVAVMLVSDFEAVS
jgi:hypothetical protein